MAGASVVRQQRVGFGERGQESRSDEAFMQFSVAFMRDGSLRQLKGAPLSAFTAAGLHEAEILLGEAEPFTLSDFIAVSGFSKPTLTQALDYLVEHHFLVELPERGRNREKQYRVAAYFWFGNARPQLPFSGVARPHPKGKDSLPLMEGKKSLPIEVGVPSSNSGEVHAASTNPGATRRIFAAAHIGGESLRWLAETVPSELATRWVRWIAWAEQNARHAYTNPPGLMIYCLRQDPGAEPPDDLPDEEVMPAPFERPEAPAYGRVGDPARAALELWDATLSELRLQMARATFDSWLRSTRAVQLTDDALTVRVPSPYAQEWLEKRLATTIQRAVTGILGRAVEVRYLVSEVRDKKAE